MFGLCHCTFIAAWRTLVGLCIMGLLYIGYIKICIIMSHFGKYWIGSGLWVELLVWWHCVASSGGGGGSCGFLSPNSQPATSATAFTVSTATFVSFPLPACWDWGAPRALPPEGSNVAIFIDSQKSLINERGGGAMPSSSGSAGVPPQHVRLGSTYSYHCGYLKSIACSLPVC